MLYKSKIAYHYTIKAGLNDLAQVLLKPSPGPLIQKQFNIWKIIEGCEITEEQIKIIQVNWAAVEPIAPQAAEIFYSKLFEADPDLKYLFRNSEMADQGAKLMKTLGIVVGGLTNLEPLIPVIQGLGKRQVDYGVKEADYKVVGESLLATLEAGLGDAFTVEAKEAWTLAYTAVAGVMIEASKGAA
jgi:hemoglobin-like flavoprotein